MFVINTYRVSERFPQNLSDEGFPTNPAAGFIGSRRDTRFQKSTSVAEAYDPYSVNDGYEDEEEEVAAAEWN